MDYNIEIREVREEPLAAAHGNTTLHNIGGNIISLLNQVYAFLGETKKKNLGINVVLYHDRGNESLIKTEAGVPIDSGVKVAEPFESDGPVKCVMTPAGTVATTTHIGPYDKLSEAHMAIRKWCNNNNHPIAGPNWEVYDHWTDDESKLRTDVFYLLN